MSVGGLIPFEDAYRLAEQAAADLAPTLEQLKAVGSLRRKRPQVGDIEFLARPFFQEDLLGGEAQPLLDDVRRVLHEIGRWIQGGDRAMRIGDLYGNEGVRLELYLVHPPAAWGSMLAIRTGPADLGKYCVSAMKRRGFYHDSGHARRLGTHEVVPTETEEQFFELAGVPCLRPMHRDQQAAKLGVGPKARW